MREVTVGKEPTPKQAAQREKFTRVSREVAEDMRGTRLKGSARVRAFNAEVGRRLKEG